MERDSRMLRHVHLPMRVLSLRTIVIIAQLGVIAFTVALAAWVWIGVTNDQYSQLDRRLDSVSSLGDICALNAGLAYVKAVFAHRLRRSWPAPGAPT